MINKIFSVTFLLVLLVSCSGGSNTSCINEKNQNLEITWGKLIISSGHELGYLLKTNREIYKFDKFPGEERTNVSLVKKIDGMAYCEAMRGIRDEIIKTQALNMPGDTVNFITYVNPDNNYSQRVMWNPEFLNKGNEGFTAVYKQLEALLNEE